MAKTNLTVEIENKLWKSTNKLGVFSCFEVTIGFGGKERVDYLTYDTKGIWRCYEIKTSKSDFYSDAAKTFVGHYNYYVMPKELYEQVKDDIPKHIGVHNGSYCIKNAKKQELGTDEQILKNSMIRSLHRENEKFIKTSDNTYVNKLKNKLDKLQKQVYEYQDKYHRCLNTVYIVRDKYNLDNDEIRELLRDN